MKHSCAALLVLLLLSACSDEKVESATPPPPTATQSAEAPSDAVTGTWGGQIKIDAHAGIGTLNYVGAESGDFVPMRFRTSSEAGAKILAVCGDDDLCEFEGSVRFLDEPPPENASAVGEIVTVDRVKKLPDAQ